MSDDSGGLLARLEQRGLLTLLLLAAPAIASAATEQPVLEARIAKEPLTITIVEGDDIAFSRVANAEEFSQSRVGQIAQDDKGFMWFGTQSGLHRFDGYSHTAFAADARSRNHVRGAFVYALHKDRTGRLWIATDQGLDIFDPSSGDFSYVDFERDKSVAAVIQSIHEDRSGAFWLSTTAGLYGLDASGRTRVHFRHEAGNPRSLSDDDVKFANEDHAGNFWVTHGAGLDAIDRATGQVFTRISLRESREINFIEDRRGTFWVYHASGDGLAILDRSTGTLTRVRFVNGAGAPISTFPIYSALEDRDGGLWFGTGGAGLLRYDVGHRRFIRYRNNSADPQSLGGDDVVELFQDREDNIWVSFHGLPLDMYPARAPSFRKLPARPGTTFGRNGRMVNSILESSNGKMWLSFAGLLLAVDSHTGEREDLSERLGLKSDVVSMAMDRRGRLWLGTVSAGLIGIEPGGKTLRFRHDPADPESLAGEVVDDILVDHAQNLWIATWGGLSRFDERHGKFVNYRPPGALTKILALAEDDKHQLWLGTHLHGLMRLNPATGEFVAYPSTGAAGGLSNGRVNDVYVDRQGIVWAGTQNGLDALDPATGAVRSYRTVDGLPGNAVSCILQDAAGGFWLGTNNGIARLDARTGDIRSYSRADGLPGLDFTAWGSCHRSAGGEMFFAGFSGATGFDPERVRAREHVPVVEFTDLVIAGQPFRKGPDNSRPQVLPDLRDLTLPYSQNMFAAGFAALNYTNPASNRYRYRLLGLEDTWRYVGGDRRVASYNSLASGRYRLEVQGATSGGTWSAARTLELTILAPWWQTSWFRWSVGLLLAAVAWLVYWLRLRQVTRQFEIRLDERVAERTRIARELHDSLLQGFHGLMFRLQAVRNQLPARPEDAARSLDEAMERGDSTVEQARVAVTDLRNFGAAVADLETALRAMAHDIPMPAHSDAPECRIVVEGARRALVPLVRDDVLQVAREAFRNALLHARARLVQIEIVWGLERFTLRVRDDGLGLDPHTITQGRDRHWGLQGMRERTQQVGGSLEIRSEGGSGTLIELGIPASRAYARDG